MTVQNTRSRKSGPQRTIAGQKHKARPVAVFDVDGTIFRSSLAIELLEELIREGVFPKKAAEGYKRELHLWRERKGSYEEYIRKVVVVLWSHLRGIRTPVVEKVAKRVLEAKRHYTYRYTRDLAKHLKKEGYFLLAISHSPRIILGPFAREFGFDEAYGSLAEIDSKGRLTGNAKNFHIIENKGNILKRVVLKFDLTLKGSVGVGDTESDASFLTLVENPICFNPNMTLYTMASKKGWKVVVERKDVVYDSLRAKKSGS